LAKLEYKELLAMNNDIDEVMFFDKNTDSIGKFRNRLKLDKFDYIFDLHNNLRSNLLCLFNGVKRSVFRKHSIRKWMLVKFKMNFFKKYPHISIRYFLSLEKYGLLNKEDFNKFLSGYKLHISKAVIEEFYIRFPLLKGYDKIIGFCPSARHKTKMYPEEKFVKMGKELIAESKTAILLLGSRNEFDYCEKIRNQIHDDNCHNLAGETSIQETSAALHECNIVVTNDTGLMHLTNLLNVPLIAIFGSTVKEFGFYPIGCDAHVFENNNLRCRPCSHIGLSTCPKGHFKCMRDINENLIIHKVKEIINSDNSLIT
jgi:lipopolysaccharide heptosyltransferase II